MAIASKASTNNWSTQQMMDQVESTKEVERRRFLQIAGAGLALAACSPRRITSDQESFGLSSSKDQNLRIVVLGAGFAGLSAAHYLRQSGLSCELYEARDRVGGRVVTKNGFNKEGMFVELGAEFVDTVHKDLIALAGELGVEVQDYNQPIPGLSEEVYFFDQKVLGPERFLGEFKKFAELVLADTRSIRKGQTLLLPSFGQSGPADASWLDQISLAEYLQRKKSQGISDDFVELINVMYLGMMGLETDRQSVYNLLILMDPWGEDIALYGDSDESKRIFGGNGRLVRALADSVEKHTPIHLEHALTRVKDDGAGFTLEFSRGAKSTKMVRADVLIVTIPVPILQKVQGLESLSLSPAKKAAIRSLGYATNAKFTIGFTERVWRTKGNHVPPNYGTVWSNGQFSEMRDSSNNQPGAHGIILNYLGGKTGEVIPPSLKEKTLQHLETMYPNIRKFHDGNVNLQHWTSDPFAGGSYICPQPGHYKTMGGFENPVELGGRMVFAGDSFSAEFGGYMNGAIETGKRAAQLVTESIKKKAATTRKS
jgi:monoamine oxidase